MLVILTDNTGTVYDQANIKQESLAELNRLAQEATGGNVWWEMDTSEEAAE